MSRRQTSRINTGSHGAYEWLVSNRSLDDLLRVCPEIVVAKYVAVTSCDSGPLTLNEVERAVGWVSRNGIAYSPRVLSAQAMPREQFDEWYVFENPIDLGRLVLASASVFETPLRADEVHAFVNFGGFALHSPKMEDIVELFWRQFDRIHPKSYIAEGDYLTVVSADRRLLASVRQSFGSLS